MSRDMAGSGCGWKEIGGGEIIIWVGGDEEDEKKKNKSIKDKISSGNNILGPKNMAVWDRGVQPGGPED